MGLIETKRLTLRKWRLSDSSDLYEYAKSELVGPSAGWFPHKSEENSRNMINYFMTCPYVYAIELKENKKVIGGIGINDRKPNPRISDKKQGEIGYDLNPKYWGRGIVPEAVHRLIEFGFEALDLDIIWCGHYKENYNSKRVNEKCGFKYSFTKEETLDQFDNKKVETLYYKIERLEYYATNNQF